MALSDLVRSMSCYYNLIERHDTHPVYVQRGLTNDCSKDTAKRDPPDGGEGPHRGSALDRADMARRSALDGRGNLNEEGLAAFVELVLQMCTDKVSFMNVGGAT